MTKEKRTRRLCASLALTVLASTTILTGMAPVVAHAEGEAPGEATSSVLVTPSLDGAAADSAPVVDVPAVEEEVEAPTEVEIEDAADVETDVPSLETSVIDKETGAEEKPAPANDEVMVEEATENQKAEKAGAPIITLGTWGTVDWTLTNEGELFLMGGTGENTNGYTPWNEISDQVKTVTFQDTVVAPEDCSYLFEYFTNVTDYNNIDRLDTSQVQYMNGMFFSNESLSSVNIDSFDVANVTLMNYMFYGAGLVSLDFSSWRFDSEVSIYEMLGRMSNLREVDFGDSEFSDYYADPFGSETDKLERLVLGKQMILENVPTKPGMYWQGQSTGYGFENTYYGGYADTYLLTPIPFQGTWGSVGWSIDDSGTLTLEGGVGADTNRQSPWWLHESSVNSIVINGNIEAPIDSSYLFYNFANLTMIENLSRLDFSKVKDMRGMFENNSSLTEIELAEEMRAVETMEGTFAGASALKHLNLADWDVSDGIDINHFLSETALDVVDLSGWDSKRVTADGAFEGMPSLEYLDISGISIPEEKASSIMRMANKLKTLVIGEDTYLREFWVPEGKIWEGQNTGHKFGLFYNSGYADTYRLTEGKLGYRVLDLVDSTGPEARYWDGGYFYGEVGEKVDLAKVELPIDYELQDPQQNISLLPFDEENWEDVYAGIELKQIPKTTTRRITFTGLPEGLLEDVTQEVKWHWEWRNEWGGGMRDSKALARVDDGWTQVYSPLNHYEAYTVPTVPGYQASVTIVAAEHVDSDEDITELNNAETVTVHYTKLSTGGGGNSADGSNTGSGSSTGTGNVANADNSTMDTSSADESLPQTGSVFASGLAALGLGLLGLLGINWRKRRRS